MATVSHLEETLLYQLKALGLSTPERNYVFHPDRKWRFDFCWPDLMLAAEVDGGTWSGGRHIRGKGYEGDCRKCNEAALLGWRVFRFTAGMVNNGEAFETLEKALTGVG